MHILSSSVSPCSLIPVCQIHDRVLYYILMMVPPQSGLTITKGRSCFVTAPDVLCILLGFLSGSFGD